MICSECAYAGRAERLRASFASDDILEFRWSVDLRMPLFGIFPNLEKEEGARGLTAEDMKRCRWLDPQLVAAIEFVEWTLDNHVRHPNFVPFTTESLEMLSGTKRSFQNSRMDNDI